MSCKKNDFRLSVLLVTYNHQKYIEKALESLFGQDFEGPIQLVVADDGSTDKTASIIREWEARDSRFCFKYLDSTYNCGITKNYQRGFAACDGEYVAVLEGDDYWVSPFKLKRQIDFLSDHWECDLCSVNYFVYEENRSQFSPRACIDSGHRLLGARDLISDNLVGNFSTCMYRKKALDALPAALYEICSYDWIVNICVARQSLIGFLQEPMSVYRLHTAGVWTQTLPVEKLKLQLELIPKYDQLTEGVFHDAFEMLASRLREAILPCSSHSGHQNECIESETPNLTVVEESPLARSFPPFVMAVGRATIPDRLKPYIVKMLRRRSV